MYTQLEFVQSVAVIWPRDFHLFRTRYCVNVLLWVSFLFITLGPICSIFFGQDWKTQIIVLVLIHFNFNSSAQCSGRFALRYQKQWKCRVFESKFWKIIFEQYIMPFIVSLKRLQWGMSRSHYVKIWRKWVPVYQLLTYGKPTAQAHWTWAVPAFTFDDVSIGVIQLFSISSCRPSGRLASFALMREIINYFEIWRFVLC